MKGSNYRQRKDIVGFPHSPMNKTITAIACVIGAVIALMAAAGGHPMSFYTTTRWVIFAVCCWGAYQNIENPKKWVLIGFIVIGVVFNPLIPFRFKRDVWGIIDVLSAIALISIGIYTIKEKKK
jgi:hypothetical protein